MNIITSISIGEITPKGDDVCTTTTNNGVHSNEHDESQVDKYLGADKDTTDSTTKPFPDHFSTKGKLALVVCILVTEMCERLAFYSVSANMVLFCTSRLGFNSVEGTTIGLIFTALSNLFPVLGGYIADSRLGRFTTIWASFAINMLGIMAVQCSAIDFHSWFGETLNQTGQRYLYLVGAFLITMGTGGVKANISPFGAEQVECMGSKAVASFFHWYYWSINLGALLAYSGVAYLQQNVSFTWGLFIPLATTMLAATIFVLPRKYYIRSDPHGSALAVTCKIIRQGCSQKNSCAAFTIPPPKDGKMFARAKRQYGGDFDDVTVDGVASVVSVLPFCALVIMYYAIYSQTTSSFFVQSEHMDVRVGEKKVPAAMLNTTGVMIILLLVPIIDRLFYPCMRAVGLPLGYLKRIGIGMLLSAIAVILAGVVEIHRKYAMAEGGGSHVQVLANENFTASATSVFLQMPQFAVIGASEIFTSVTCLEFAYTQAPKAFQGVLTGLFLAAWGLGNCLSVAMMLLVEKATQQDPWYGSEINDVKMENYMFLLASLMGLNLLAFTCVSYRLKHQDKGIESTNPPTTTTTTTTTQDIEMDVVGT